MQQDIEPRSAATGHIFKLVRFVVVGTLALAALLLVADFAGRGWNDGALRYLSENVLTTLVYGVAAEVIAAIAAATCLSLWKQ